MATKKQTTQATNEIFFDQSFDVAESKIRITVNAETIDSDINAYYDRLLFSRGIPSDQENISPRDPLVQIALSNLGWIKNEKEKVKSAMSMASLHYKKLADDAYKEAVFLAMTTHPDNVFGFEPEPYDIQIIRSLPGIEETPLPNPEKKLTNPVERRLKQIFDLLSKDVSVLRAFEEAFTTSAVLLGSGGEEKDEAGFQS